MAEGDIGAPVDKLEFDTADITSPDIIHVDGDIYAIAYMDNASKGQVVTVDIAADGQIGAAVIDKLEFGLGSFLDPCIIHVSGDIYVIAYSDNSNHGQVVSVDIASDGQIGAAVIDSLEFIAGDGYYPDIIHVSGDIFAIVYMGAFTDGFVCTVDMASDGQIGAAVIDSLEFGPSDGNYPKIIHVSGDIYAIAYTGAAQDGFVCTVDIASDGQIGAAVIDVLEFDTATGYEPVIINVSGDIFAIAYRSGANDGFVCTVDIASDGQIGAAVIDVLEFDATRCVLPDIIHVGGDIFAIAYEGDAFDGYICTVEIASDGQIGAAVIGVLEHDTLDGKGPSIVHVSGDIYAIAYKGQHDDGFVSTPTIEAPLLGEVKYLMMVGIG